MKQIINGDRESLSSEVDEINQRNKLRLIPSNDIVYAKLDRDKLVLSGIFCKAVGKILENNGALTIEIKVRLRIYFVFIGIFILIFFSGFIFGDNVTINGNQDPSIWRRIGFASIGIVLILLGAFILSKIRASFENRVIEKIKNTGANNT
jgi:hypothetical protein